ncbi:MAG: molybdopterin-dependent oxidoreductase [Alphaproteobacteria bacterium]|nr:molybdopterin-dependent oxidoreductase [Alphaproteobacteria bacterium]
MSPRTALLACPLCEATCGLRVTVDGDRVTEVRGDPDDPFSQGHICPKGVAIGELHHDPDRLRRPVEKQGGTWVELSWEQALDRAADGIRALQSAHGPDSVAVYQGNPTVHNLGAMLYGGGVVRALRTKQRYSATSCDQLPHQLCAFWMFGHQLLVPLPDVDRTDLMLIFGGNPAASNGSLMTAPGIDRRLRAIRQRGGRVVLFDPRRTETARLCDAHHFVRPGTDALVLAAMLQVLFAEDRVRIGRLSGLVDGVDALADAVAACTPERAEAGSGVPADEIRTLARALADAERAVVYGRLGVSTQRHGVLCHWLIGALNLLTGHLDEPGGAMFTTPAVDPIGLKLIGRGSYGRWRSTVRGRPEVLGELPAAVMAEELGSDAVRGLLCIAGNPVLSTPDGAALERSLAGLDFMVSIDPFVTETSRHADLILPPVGPLSRPHYDVVFNLLAVRNVARWSEPLFPPGPDDWDDGRILAGLHVRLTRGMAQVDARARRKAGQARIIDLALRLGPHGKRLFGEGLSLAALKQHASGLDLGPLQPVLPERLFTDRIDLGRAEVLAELPRLLAAEPPAGLLLIGRRHLRSNNSWMHNSPSLMKGKPRCTLLVHPDDAAARGLVDGGTARVRSSVGQVQAPVQVSDAVMPGVVSLPHGFGHHRDGVGWSVAAAHAGVSINDLIPGDRLDEVGGTAVLSGVPVEVEAL